VFDALNIHICVKHFGMANITKSIPIRNERSQMTMKQNKETGESRTGSGSNSVFNTQLCLLTQ